MGDKEYNKLYDIGLKYKVMEHYSNGPPYCKECGCHDLYILQLDHINNDGKEQRERMVEQGIPLQTTGGIPYYQWLRKNNYPHELQVLCAKCNRSKPKAIRTKIKFAFSVEFGYVNPIPDVRTQSLWESDG